MRLYDLPPELFQCSDFHIHTSYTDGSNTVYEYCQKAVENGLGAIAFSEHVRKDLQYDYSDLCNDVAKAREMFHELQIFIGCEAKVLNLDGELDIPGSILGKMDFITAVYHGFPYDAKEEYLTSLRSMISDPSVDIWGHPTLLPTRKRMPLYEGEIKDIVSLCIQNKVLIERNIKYGLPDAGFVAIAKEMGARFIIGSDSHSIRQLPNRPMIQEEWKWISRTY